MHKILLILLLSKSIFAQSVDLQKLEKEILDNNKHEYYQKSQTKLLDILENKTITAQERARINIMLATTHKFLSDYPATISYLIKAKNIAETIPNDSSLKMTVYAELGFAYFDSNKYKEADTIMKQIAADNYKHLDEGSKTYIIMQEGYLLYLKKDYLNAGLKYENALKLIKKVSPCNVPVILVKQMQLFAAEGKLTEAQNKYNEVILNADSCNVKQYKIYASEELKTIYEKNNMHEKAMFYMKVLDSLKISFDRDNKVSKLHIENQKHLESQKIENEKSFLIRTAIFILAAIILVIIGYYFFRKAAKHKKEKEATEIELAQYKKELEIYSKEQFSNENKLAEIDINNSDKLSERQKELIKLIAEGLSNKEIGEKLFISEATVKYHTRNIYEILQLKNRTDFFAKILKK